MHPAQTTMILAGWHVYLPALGAILVFLAHPQRRLSTPGLAMVLMCGVLLIPSLLSVRFFDNFFPFVVLLGARSWAELAANQSLCEWRRRNAAALVVSICLLVSCLAFGLFRGSVLELHKEVRGMNTGEAWRPAIEFLDRVARPDDLVYHNFWWDFSVLYHYRPAGRYVVALDPVFFHRHDSDLFRKSLEAYRGETGDLSGMLKENFNARWLFLPKKTRNTRLFYRIQGDPGFTKEYEDAYVLIVRLR